MHDAVTLRQAKEAMEWALAERFLEDQQEGYTPGYTGSQVRMSANKVSQYIKTVQAFPVEQRELEVPFDIHRICAQTDVPAFWLRWVVMQEASAQELRRQIALTKVGPSDSEWLRRGASLVQQWQRWQEQAPAHVQDQLQTRMGSRPGEGKSNDSH